MWFKVHVMHGPGHQSETEEYVWRIKRPCWNERDEMFKSFCESNYLRNAIGDVKLAQELPEKVRLEKIEWFKREIVYAQKMLKILGAPVLEPFVF